MKSKIKKITSLFLAVLGFALVAYTLLPIILFDAKTTIAQDYLSPVPEEISYSRDDFSIDYTKASNWFAGAGGFEKENSGIRYYQISVPSLGISNATVSMGGEDLSESLIQHPGTAAPGEVGNSVVYGHSVLPQFFDPKNYLSIFSTLPTIEKGAEVIVKYDGIRYKYVVEEKFEVKPTDLEVLNQSKTASYITLITCTPPGHPLKPKRLIVRAKLVPYER